MATEIIYLMTTVVPGLVKIGKTGTEWFFHRETGRFVNAPAIKEFPIAVECELVEIIDTENMHAVIGKILNVSVEEEVITEGNIDPAKINALIFDPFQSGYFEVGKRIRKKQFWMRLRSVIVRLTLHKAISMKKM